MTLLSVHAQAGSGPYFHLRTVQKGGHLLTRYIIGGPAHPPAGYEVRPAVSTPQPGEFSTDHILTVPAFDWVFGCSSVSGAMIAGYYDRNGFANIYTGPTGGGVTPLDNSTWGTWSDGADTYPNIPLAASHMGVDGLATKGSIDDYWVQYGSSANDPYISGSWTQHAWGTAIGDYMKTSQSAYGNSDGSTSFYNYTDVPDPGPLTCTDMEGYGIASEDGTYGRKLFYEARGYMVTDCYSWRTDNNNGGFTYAMYKAEIDAGNPVMLNLAGHTIVGVGYDDASNTIYVHDTWDYLTHSMQWGGIYSGMELLSVSIVHFQEPPAPADFSKVSPVNGSPSQPTMVNLSWNPSTYASSYRYCIDADDNGTCNSAWIDVGTNTHVAVSGLSVGVHSWQVRAINGTGSTYANSNTWWTFTVVPVQSIYLPVIHKSIPQPGAFSKTSPLNGEIGVSTNPLLQWNASTNVTSYEYCFDRTNDNTCNGTGGVNGTTSWTSVGANTSVALSSLQQSTTYYWQVRANGAGGITYAGGGWWSFTTAAVINGDFELGSTGWTQYSSHGWAIIVSYSAGEIPVIPRSGNWAAWLGGDYNDVSYVQQSMFINPATPYLVYYHWIGSQETSCGSDKGMVRVNGTVVNQYNLCTATNTGAWIRHSVNLASYANQTVTVQIRTETNGTLNSNLFVDDVSFAASAAAEAAPRVQGVDPSALLMKSGLLTPGPLPVVVEPYILLSIATPK